LIFLSFSEFLALQTILDCLFITPLYVRNLIETNNSSDGMIVRVHSSLPKNQSANEFGGLMQLIDYKIKR
jgi:hypothetical protein